MKIYKKVVMEIIKTEKVVCNMCGCDMENTAHCGSEEYISIEKCWGYSSRYDGECHRIDLCQCCYEEIIKTFKISPLSE
ncbi:MAG: hypothetical protein FWD82_10500 [Defluviitaleaceae bacterium]|nr:hypothetical protein [Defluviitaleaceae bacterium]